MASHCQSHSAKEEDESSTNTCAICLGPVLDQTIIVPCRHSAYCFKCVLSWTEQSKRCPLCSGQIDHLLHRLALHGDSERYYPIPLLPPVAGLLPSRSVLPVVSNRSTEGTANLALRGQSSQPSSSSRTPKQALQDPLRGLERRCWIYRHALYAKHIPSNTFTGFKPISHQDFVCQPQVLLPRTSIFLQRELSVFSRQRQELDYRIAYVIQVLKVLDCDSVGAVRLFSELLGSLSTAEHFAHELMCFLRSPYQELSQWDAVIQYPAPTDVKFHPREVIHRDPSTQSASTSSRSRKTCRDE